MKLTCTQENLLRGLSIIGKLGDKNTTLPILNNVLLQARKQGLIITTTNLEIAIRTVVRGKIDEEGDFTVQGKLIFDLVSSLKKENIVIELLQDKTLTIKGEHHETAVRGLDAGEFPLIPEVEDQISFEVGVSDFSEALRKIAFAMSADESRIELNGAYFQINEEKCIIAATDSYRLAEASVAVVSKKQGEKNIIIPNKTVHELMRILDITDSETVTMKINETQVLFIAGETELVSRIISGNYPDYRQIIPTQFKQETTFPINEMVRAIKTTSLFCKPGINDIRISLDKRFADIAVQAENNTSGKNISHVKTADKGNDIDIVFNYKFILDALQHLAGETAILKTNDAQSPAVAVSPKDPHVTYVIMPIRQQ